MKTILHLFLFAVLLSSCNSARFYANYRVGGKSTGENKELLVSASDSSVQKNAASSEIATCEKTDTLIIQDSLSGKKTEESVAILSIPASEEKKLTAREHKTHEANKKPTETPAKKKNEVRKHIFAGKNPFAGKSKIDWQEVWDAIIGGFLILSLIILIIHYLATANFSISAILSVLAIIGVCILFCAALGKLIEGIFPGMSNNRKSSFLKKIFPRFTHKGAMKYYGGMSVKTYFWIGMGVWLVAFIIASAAGASEIVFSIVMGFLVVHLAICLFGALIVGFLSLFPGMQK